MPGQGGGLGVEVMSVERAEAEAIDEQGREVGSGCWLELSAHK